MSAGNDQLVDSATVNEDTESNAELKSQAESPTLPHPQEPQATVTASVTFLLDSKKETIETPSLFMISFPRDGDANYVGHWGHDEQTYMNGWTSGKAVYYMKIRTIGSTVGNICYCIEPGIPLNIGDKLTEWDENFGDNYPSSHNKTIPLKLQ